MRTRKSTSRAWSATSGETVLVTHVVVHGVLANGRGAPFVSQANATAILHPGDSMLVEFTIVDDPILAATAEEIESEKKP